MIKGRWYILTLLVVLSCEKVDLDGIRNLNGNKIWIIGHAGEGFQTGRHPVPTNSETSIVKAIEYHNAHGVEVDVQLSKDSVLILFHDEYLEQTTHCIGCVNQSNSTDLLNCRFKQDFTVNVLANEKLVSLERIFEKYSKSPFKPVFFLDMKLSSNCAQNSEEYLGPLASELVRIISKYGMSELVFICSDNYVLLMKIQTQHSGIKLIFNIGAGDFYYGMGVSLDHGFYGLEIYNDYINKEQVKEAHSNNLWVITYGVKDRHTQIDAVEKSPDAIITDNIPLLQQILQDQR